MKLEIKLLIISIISLISGIIIGIYSINWTDKIETSTVINEPLALISFILLCIWLVSSMILSKENI